MASAFIFAAPYWSRPVNRALTRWLTHGSVVVADLLGIITAGVLAVIIRYSFHAQFVPRDYLSFSPSILIFLVVFGCSGLYPGVPRSPIDEFRLILRSASIGFLVLIGATFFLREGILSSRLVFLLAWLLTILLVPVSRRLVRGWCSRQPWWGIPTVILGEREAGSMMLDLLAGHSRVGLRPVALLAEDGESEPLPFASPQLVFQGDLSEAKHIATGFRDCYALIAMPNGGSDRVKEVFDECAAVYRKVLIIPDLFGMRSLSVATRDICGVLALQVDHKLTFFPQTLKRCFDIGVACASILLLSPMLLLLYLGVRFTSPGPVFYGQPRIGKDEVPFRVWKFRSMVVNADAVLQSHLDVDPLLREEWARDHKLRQDPRVTWFGRILRKTSLDELPQLWNVIRGEMSLVGPRPIVQSEVEKYGRIFEQYQRVSPGVTGLWQISGRNNTTYELRTRIDEYYVRNWSLSLDIYILLRTLKTLFFSEGAY